MGGAGWAGWRFRRPVRSQPSLLSHQAQLCPHLLCTLLYCLPYVLVFGVPRCITVGVCHQAGVGWVELMHFVVCRVCFVLFLHPKRHQNNVCKGVRNHDPSALFFFYVPSLCWWLASVEGLEDIYEKLLAYQICEVQLPSLKVL